PPGGTATVTGLLRLTEPKGAFLRYNDPGTNRWYSRDVSAISTARGLGPVAPYFIDADAGPAATAPVGGLTVERFTNNHLVYGLTWFALAVMV
ncbi:Surfeit locus 1 family protein, partial [Pseudomonas sp. GW456-11-11-14-TSB2]|uniref:SURF1 family protein n=1 Tax=Pseudomonas sp. GW456-11-11-14-TSB2 TaxID=2751348 RepID=UPI000CB5E131